MYTNWTVLLEGKGGFHPASNPFLRVENRDCRLEIKPDCCLKTLDILARTGSIGMNINWTLEQCDEVASALCQAAREVLA